MPCDTSFRETRRAEALVADEAPLPLAGGSGAYSLVNANGTVSDHQVEVEESRFEGQEIFEARNARRHWRRSLHDLRHHPCESIALGCSSMSHTSATVLCRTDGMRHNLSRRDRFHLLV